MRVVLIIGNENRKAIEAALRKYIPMIKPGADASSSLTDETDTWLDVVLDVVEWCEPVDGRPPFLRLLLLRYAQKRSDKEIAQALCVDRSTVFKMLEEVQTYAAIKAIEYGLIAVGMT